MPSNNKVNYRVPLEEKSIIGDCECSTEELCCPGEISFKIILTTAYLLTDNHFFENPVYITPSIPEHPKSEGDKTTHFAWFLVWLYIGDYLQ